MRLQACTPHQDESLGSELLSPQGNNAAKHQQTSLPRSISKEGCLLASRFANTWENALKAAAPLHSNTRAHVMACGVTNLGVRIGALSIKL